MKNSIIFSTFIRYYNFYQLNHLISPAPKREKRRPQPTQLSDVVNICIWYILVIYLREKLWNNVDFDNYSFKSPCWESCSLRLDKVQIWNHSDTLEIFAVPNRLGHPRRLVVVDKGFLLFQKHAESPGNFVRRLLAVEVDLTLN